MGKKRYGRRLKSTAVVCIALNILCEIPSKFPMPPEKSDRGEFAQTSFQTQTIELYFTCDCCSFALESALMNLVKSDCMHFSLERSISQNGSLLSLSAGYADNDISIMSIGFVKRLRG